MNLGFEVVAARSKKTDANDDLAFEPMRQRARKEPRKQPSTDEKKVKRRLNKSALAWSRRDSLDHDTEFVRYVLLSDTEALEASVIRDETMDEPTWAWLVSVIDRQDGGILEFVMSGSASGLDEAKGKADVALDRAEMDMMFERVGSRKQAASDHQETIWYLTGYLMGYNGDAQPDDDAPFSVMTGYSAGSDDLADGKPSNYTRADLDYVTEAEYMTSDDVADFFEKRGSRKQANGYYNDRPIMVPSLADLPADREDMAWYEVSSQRRSSGEAVMEVEFSGGSALQAKRAADELLTDPDVMFVLFTRSAGRGTYGVQMNASRKQAAKNYYVFDEWADDTGSAERPLAGPFASAEEASAVLKDVAYPFQFPYGPETVVGDLFIAEGLPQMDTQDFINQTLSNKQAGYHYQPDTESSFDVNQYDESPGEPFAHPSGHTYSGPEPAEATGESYVGSRSSSMQREADILEAMRFASLTEQRQLMAELNTIRANRTAARQADRDIDLTAAVIEDRLTPVLTKSMHTVATDWLTEVPTLDGDGDGTAREMVAQASVWFKRLSSEVVADRDEFAEQARGKARQLTSSLGVGREAAIASFLDAAAHLRAKKSAANEPTYALWHRTHDQMWVIQDASASDYRVMVIQQIGTGKYFWEIFSVSTGVIMDEGEADTLASAQMQAERAFQPLKSASKQANELMGYGEGEYVTNAGDDMMMDDMSGMDMDPRYETNASRKHAEWDQSAFDAWMKQVDSKMVGMSGLGASDLPDQPYADWFEDGMSASEAAQLSLSDTADEMGFGGLFGSRKRSSRKVAYLPHEGEGDITNSRGDDFYRYAEDGNTEWFYIYANTLFHLKEFHNIDLTDTFIHLDDGGPGLQMEELVQSAHALEHEGDSGVYGSRKQAALSVQHLIDALNPPEHAGFGYADAVRTIEGMSSSFSVDDVHGAVVEAANNLHLTRDELAMWTNSKWARWLGDALTFLSDRPGYGEDLKAEVRKHLNMSIINELASQLSEEDSDRIYGVASSRKQAMPQKYEIDAYTADELTGGARSRARQDWDVMQWDLFVADDISEYLNEELARKLPSFAGTKVVWDVGFSQGDGVWLETGPLSRQQVLDLGVDLPQGVSLEVVSSGAGRVNLEANYSLDTDSDEEFEIQDLRNAAETELNGVLYDLYQMARAYVMDAGSEEYWIDWADENDVLYDQSGRIIRQGSRKQAMPSDDLIDVDIEDYMGGDEGPDPDSQSGHAETALPYAGDDTTPAFRETGWTGKRKRRATRKTSADMSSLEMYDSYYEQVADSVAGAKVDPSGSGVIVGGVSYKVMRNRDSGSVYLQASNGRTLSLDNAQVDPRVGMPFYGDVADAVEHMARNASRKTAAWDGVKNNVVIFVAVEDATAENHYAPNVMWHDEWTVAEMPALANMTYDDIIDEFELELGDVFVVDGEPRMVDHIASGYAPSYMSRVVSSKGRNRR